MKIGFLGLGKLGLPVALAIESKGHQVLGTDINDLTLRNIRFKTINYKRRRCRRATKKISNSIKNFR
jgi:UDP-N-acetyl-D-mannosaminuronate dehydrogenase